MPAAGRLEPERGIADERDGEAQGGVELVRLDAVGWAGNRREIHPRLPCDPDRVEAVHLEEPPEYLAHRGEAGVARAGALFTH